MKTRPRGIHATFAVGCPRCNGEFTVSNGRVDDHECASSDQPMTPNDIQFPDSWKWK